MPNIKSLIRTCEVFGFESTYLEEYWKVINRLVNLYFSLGFKNTNDIFGNYETKITMVYNEGIGKELLDRVGLNTIRINEDIEK